MKYQRKRKNIDPEAFKEDHRLKVAKYRNDESEDGRLRNFLDATMYGPIFICVCCHGKMFKTNVQFFTDETIKKIKEKIPIESCIVDVNLVTNVVTV